MARNASPPTNPLRRLFGQDQQQDFFRALADRLEDAVIVLSADGGQILACNHAFLLLSGYSRAELASLAPADLFQGEPGARFLVEAFEAEDGRDTLVEDLPLRTRQAGIEHVDARAGGIASAGSPILVTATPSYWRKDHQAEHEARLERLEGLVQFSATILEGDIANLEAALSVARRMLRASVLGLYRVSATSPDYVLDGDLPEAFARNLPADEVKSKQRTSTWTLGQRPEGELPKAARASGLTTMMLSSIGPPNARVGLLVVGWQSADELRDDTEKLLELIAHLCHSAIQASLQQAASADIGSALKALQVQAEAQLDAVADAVLALDGDLRVIRANQAACNMLGYDLTELENHRVQDILVGPEDIVATLLDALGHERAAERPRVTFHRREGTPFPVHLRAVPVGGATETQLILVLSDQSERQAIEDQNEFLAQRALLGEVSAIFAHEVRNPINNISTGIQLVASRLGQGHPLYDSLDRVRKECTRLDQLMSDVLFFTRRLEVKMEPIDLGDMIARLLERWKPRLKQAGVRVHTTVGEDLPPVLADPRTLEQVLVNLITNALQAMPQGGTLSASVDNAEGSFGKMVELKIADTGPGIPQDIVERIFDPFFTTKKDGTGLGLAISRRILSAHKGHIQVESFPDAGTVFKIHLPIASQDIQESV